MKIILLQKSRNVDLFLFRNTFIFSVHQKFKNSKGTHKNYMGLRSYRFKVPKIGSLGLIYLEEQLTELREKFNLLVTGLLLKEQQMEVIHRKRV